jgi:hypothetical protein
MSVRAFIRERRPALASRARAIASALLGRAPPAPLWSGKGRLDRRERREVLAWLRPLESIARILIILASLVLPWAALAPPARARLGSDTRDRDPDDGLAPPSFRLEAASGPSGGVSPFGRVSEHDGEPEELFSAWLLAERLQAVLDALADPGPHVRRLARRLGREPGRDAASASRANSDARPPRRSLRCLSPLGRLLLEAEALELVAEVDALDSS